MLTTSPEFKSNAKKALADAGLQKALKFSKPQFMARRSAAVANLPEFERLRDIARDIKNHTLANLDFYLEQFAANVEANGGQVLMAPQDIPNIGRFATVQDPQGAVTNLYRSATGDGESAECAEEHGAYFRGGEGPVSPERRDAWPYHYSVCAT